MGGAHAAPAAAAEIMSSSALYERCLALSSSPSTWCQESDVVGDAAGDAAGDAVGEAVGKVIERWVR